MNGLERLQRVRLRKLECQRHLRLLEQKLAANPRDSFARREMERWMALLAELEAEEERLVGGTSKTTGGDQDVIIPVEGPDSSGG